MQEIYLVRHAETRQDKDAPSAAWQLTEAGRMAAAMLSGLPEPVFSSPEPKAVQTALALTASLVTIEAFLEHDNGRTGWLSAAEFAGAAERYFAEPDAAVWGETHAQAVLRFRTGLEEVVVQSNGAPACTIVTRGRILCSYLGSIGGTSGYEIWKTLTMPAVARLRWESDGFRLGSVSLMSGNAGVAPQSLS